METMAQHTGIAPCLSRTPKCCLKSWLHLFLAVVICSISKSYGEAGISSHGKSENNGCSAVRVAYGQKGLNEWDVPNSPRTVWHLRICQHGSTCCTEEMELKLDTQSQQEFDEIMVKKVDLLQQSFITRTAKFDAFFIELLDNAKKDLHDMFVKTYGLLYEQNSHVFTDLFYDLKSYYKGRDINLLDALDNFFSTLLQKMFELLNSQYSFDDAYLQCVTEHMDRLQPFGDVPRKLAVQVKRAFVAARTFVQGLAVGRDAIISVSKLQVSGSCQKAITKMLYCPYCSGHVSSKPCNNYCMNVMKGCLAHHAELNTAWNTYIDSMMNIMDRLEGPFNIERVVEPIDVKISDAIMNFQENSETVSTKVFQGCGKPSYSRKKRTASANTYDEDYFNNWKYTERYGESPITAAGTSLDRLVRDIKDKIKVARDFWKGLPHGVCNDWAEPVYEEYKCWNGLRISKYMPEVMRDGLMHQINNPEVDVDIRRTSSLVNQQILQLKLITNKLDNAFKGMDVDWVDTEGFAENFGGDHGGSGSGGGSGDGGSGSGAGIPPYYPGDNTDDFHWNNQDPWSIRPYGPTRGPKSGSGPGYPGDTLDTRNKPPYEYPPSGGATTLHQPVIVLLLLSVYTFVMSRL